MERDGNGWVECDLGHRHWGLHGAAGLLIHTVDADGTLRVLLQHRADWCHHGGTWGLPGGARDSHESVEEAALREAVEETALDGTKVRLRHTFVDDHGGWSYTTVYGDALTALPTVPNEESAALEWVATDRVNNLPLHPGFGHTWAQVQLVPITVVVDAANVLGATPNGWWKGRAGATEQLGQQLAELHARTLHTPTPDDSAVTGVVTEVHVVVEGAARSAQLPGVLHEVRAPESGDDALVASSGELSKRGRLVVVTSDRELRDRVTAATEGGAAVRGARWLLDVLDQAPHSAPETGLC
ncbi:MAG: NUDIX domain-containing protein [Actinomycetia bacterium]|nr:NUDIX domain-containing protein [Actinomycetes bacterium]